MSSSGWGPSGPVLAGTLRPCKRERVMALCIEECMKRAATCGAATLDLGQSPVTRTSLETAWGVSPYQALGWHDESGLSQVIDLSAEPEALWHAVKPKVRREIERARAAGVHARQVDWVSSVDSYYAMHAETYQRTGVDPHPREYFAGIAREMGPRGNAMLWAALDASGEPVAFHNVARFGAGAYYHTGCSRNDLPHPAVGHLLFWEVLLGMRAAGVRWYDCGAVEPGARSGKIAGLSLFKTRFGGELHRSFRMREQILAGTGAEGAGHDASPQAPGTRIRERLLRSASARWRSWLQRRDS
jgi:hypothetical protein